MPHDDHGRPSTTALLQSLVDQISGLFRGEVDLLKAEMSEKAQTVGSAMGMVVAGVVVVLVALHALAAAAIFGLIAYGLHAGYAALAVGAVLALVALVLIKSGLAKVKNTSLTPERTANNVRKDAQVMKEKTHVG
ncbi:phage holin family protein [Primorskyibacter sedentarius]|uniref:Putative superfamily III holin-X n=1 Tax=Primorskyibacter sedentarius TaxID=745311 RepID=A0A4R3JIM1_9RHOB|nr:phage holin family protein [Primorskyibacter sedentarius]TCS65872.1 putative superfamily III holin-X [Primorskyibacter sedentarius]